MYAQNYQHLGRAWCVTATSFCEAVNIPNKSLFLLRPHVSRIWPSIVTSVCVAKTVKWLWSLQARNHQTCPGPCSPSSSRCGFFFVRKINWYFQKTNCCCRANCQRREGPSRTAGEMTHLRCCFPRCRLLSWSSKETIVI